MEIYVVQQDDTIYSVANKFGISVQKLISDNNIEEPYQLVTGQTLVITFPKQVYTVKEGDTLTSIADIFHISIIQLLRNNPFLIDRQYIYPGETLVISYDNSNGELWIVGYTYPFIADDILLKTLPYLTYLLIFNYRVSNQGDLVGNDKDINIIDIAKSFGVPSTMVLSTYSYSGEVNLDTEYEVLSNIEIQNKIIDNMISIMQEKGYSSVNLAFQNINVANQSLYMNFLTKVSNRLKPEGYSIFLTIDPGLTYTEQEVTYEKIDYSEFSRISDGILFLSYDWGSVQRPPLQFSIITLTSLLDYIVSQVPLDKIRIGLPTLGYDWKLPYIPGKSSANALSFDSALALARETSSTIHFDENTLSAFYEYVDDEDKPHIVWFKDARSIDTSIKILQSYGIKDIGIWNIMYYFAQMWQVINTQYEIDKVTDDF